MRSVVAALAAVAVAVAPGGHRVTLNDPGLSIVVPRGWHLAQKQRTALGYPVERIALSSARLGPPHPSSTRPGAEVRRMGPRDALLFVVEYTRPMRPFARKPPRFVLRGP